MNFRINRYSAAALRSSLAAVAGALLLASCGGGGSGTNYVPSRLIVFGDEFSMMVKPDGSGSTDTDAKKYSINGFTPDTITPDCYSNLLWIQTLAYYYGLGFAECNDVPGATPTAFIKAEFGAKVAGVVRQIDNFLTPAPAGQGGRLVKSDLVTVMVGTNDVIELYERVRLYQTAPSDSNALTREAALTEAARRGELLADQFDRVTQYGSNDKARALYVLIPNVGDSPYGYSQESTTGGSGSRDLLKRLTIAFNDELRSKITINGRSIGQVNIYDTFNNVTNPKKPSDVTKAGILNTKDAACLDEVTILECTSSTLQPGTDTVAAASESTWLWAKDWYFGPIGHSLLGNNAIAIVNNNPF
jgi:outer membrane lipase/esterase